MVVSELLIGLLGHAWNRQHAEVQDQLRLASGAVVVLLDVAVLHLTGQVLSLESFLPFASRVCGLVRRSHQRTLVLRGREEDKLVVLLEDQVEVLVLRRRGLVDLFAVTNVSIRVARLTSRLELCMLTVRIFLLYLILDEFVLCGVGSVALWGGRLILLQEFVLLVHTNARFQFPQVLSVCCTVVARKLSIGVWVKNGALHHVWADLLACENVLLRRSNETILGDLLLVVMELKSVLAEVGTWLDLVGLFAAFAGVPRSIDILDGAIGHQGCGMSSVPLRSCVICRTRLRMILH